MISLWGGLCDKLMRGAVWLHLLISLSHLQVLHIFYNLFTCSSVCKVCTFFTSKQYLVAMVQVVYIQLGVPLLSDIHSLQPLIYTSVYTYVTYRYVLIIKN